IVARGKAWMFQVVPGEEGPATLTAECLWLAVAVAGGAVPTLEGYKIWIGHLTILPDQRVRVTFYSLRVIWTGEVINEVAGDSGGFAVAGLTFS
ncbi:MAG: hypothetical protein WEB67_06205, partial [Acidimicrobiia bacterium]